MAKRFRLWVKIKVNYGINLEKWIEMLYDDESKTWREVDGLYS